MKRCCTCKLMKDESEFHKGARRCKPCAVAYAAEWALRNPEKVKRAQKKHRELHADKERERRRKWAELNPDKVRAQWERSNEKRKLERAAYLNKAVRTDEELRQMARDRSKRYAMQHPDRVASSLARRRAAKLSATPSWANSFFVREAYNLARLRTKVTGKKWHVDHIVPLRSKIVCGLHCEANLQVVIDSENYRKSNIRWPNMPA